MTPLYILDVSGVWRGRNAPVGPSWPGFSFPAFNVGDPSSSNAFKPIGVIDEGFQRNVGPRFDEFRCYPIGSTLTQPTEPGVFFANDERVRVTFQARSNYDPSVSYYVVNATLTTFQLSLTSGGSAVDSGTPSNPAFVGVAYTSEAPTVYVGDIELVGADPGISNLDVFGNVTVKNTATGTPTAVDCIVRGQWNVPIVNSWDTNAAIWGDSLNLRGLQASWCRIDLHGRETPFTDGFRGGNGTFDYGEIYRAVDALSFNYPTGTGGGVARRSRTATSAYFAWHDDNNPGSNCAMLASLLARGVTVWPGHSDKRNHSDGNQIFQGGPWTVEGMNMGGPRSLDAPAPTFLDPYNPTDAAIIDSIDRAYDHSNAGGIMVNTDQPGTYPINATITKNWFEGGPSNVNCGVVSPDFMAGVTVSYNQCKATTPANARLIRNTSQGGLASFVGNVDENFIALNPSW